MGEDHEKIADSYHVLGKTQYTLRDYTSAAESHKQAFKIRRMILGEDHRKTADSYHELGKTQYVLTDYNSATVSHKRALNIRRKILGEDHRKTADSYHELEVTQLFIFLFSFFIEQYNLQYLQYNLLKVILLTRLTIHTTVLLILLTIAYSINITGIYTPGHLARNLVRSL